MKRKIIIGLLSIVIITPLVLEGLTILKSPNINKTAEVKVDKLKENKSSSEKNNNSSNEIKYLNLSLKKVVNRFEKDPYEYDLKSSMDERGITHYYGESKDKSKGNMTLKFYGKEGNLSEIHFKIFPEEKNEKNPRRAKQIEKTLQGLTTMTFKNHEEVDKWIENAGGKIRENGKSISKIIENKKITLSANQLTGSLDLDIIGE